MGFGFDYCRWTTQTWRGWITPSLCPLWTVSTRGLSFTYMKVTRWLLRLQTWSHILSPFTGWFFFFFSPHATFLLFADSVIHENHIVVVISSRLSTWSMCWLQSSGKNKWDMEKLSLLLQLAICSPSWSRWSEVMFTVVPVRAHEILEFYSIMMNAGMVCGSYGQAGQMECHT
jgi:hypothetical protein